MTDGHRRHLTTSARHIGQLLSEADRYAHDARTRDALRTVREVLRDFAREFGLDSRAPDVDPLHAIRVQLTVASISVVEMRSRAMRGYGPLDDADARELDAACDRLESAIASAQQAVDAP